MGTYMRAAAPLFPSLCISLPFARLLCLEFLQIHGAKVYTFEKATADKISKTAARFWLLGLTFSLASGSYKTYVLQQRAASAKRPRATAEKEADRKIELAQISTEQAAVRYQMTQDALDWLIPATGADILGLDEGILGLAGCASSIMGARTQWRAVNGSSAAKSK